MCESEVGKWSCQVKYELLTDWNKDPGKYCDPFWQGWDKILTDEIKTKYKIVDIGKYN